MISDIFRSHILTFFSALTVLLLMDRISQVFQNAKKIFSFHLYFLSIHNDRCEKYHLPMQYTQITNS